MKVLQLLGIVIAAIGLVLPVSSSFAQQNDPGDQPGLLADDSVVLEPEFQRTAVLYRTTEPPGTIIIQTAERHLYLIQGNGRIRRSVEVSDRRCIAFRLRKCPPRQRSEEHSRGAVEVDRHQSVESRRKCKYQEEC